MHRLLMATLVLTCGATAAAEARFSGAGALAPAPARTIDQRYDISARLRPVPPVAPAAQRFSANAGLRVKRAPNNAQGICGAVIDGVFADGFE